MGARRSWWQQIQKHRRTIGLVTIVFIVVVVIALIIAVVLFNGTGFNGYNKVTTVHTFSGTNVATVTRTEEYQPGKTLWDLLQLLGVLAIPVVVGLGAAWYTAQQGKVSERENKDSQREDALQAYLDKLTELLLKEHLGERTANGQLKPEYEAVRKIARVRTLTVLRDLKSDAERKESILEILYESGLIDMGKRIIDLSGGDLSQADVSGADLSGADLSGANLRKANLSNAILFNANFSNAILEEANFNKSWVTREQLKQAKSLKGATMPDGSLHE